jgi:hypothetical protein
LRLEVRDKLNAGVPEVEIDQWLDDKLADALAAHAPASRRTFVESTAKATP